VYVNVKALLVLAAFAVLLALATSFGSSAMHLGEAIVTVLIAVGLAGYAFRGGQRRM
jgi:hypothetical protein